MIVPNILVLLPRGGPEMLFDVFRRVDALNELGYRHGALWIEQTAIERREQLLNERWTLLRVR